MSQPATPRNLRDLAASSKSEATTQALHEISEMYAQKVLAKRVSLLDILESNPDIQPTFTQYLEMLPPIRIRQYSISSSPLWNPHRVALTISVIKAPALSGKDEEFMGVATTYLDGLRPGDRVQMTVRRTGAFHLPPDPSVPVVMIATGSGVAPMRGFIQERVLQKEAGRYVGKMTLFFGCRFPDDDFLYFKTDFEKWSKLGILEVRPAFSRDSGKSEGCKYVQEYVTLPIVYWDGFTDVGTRQSYLERQGNHFQGISRGREREFLYSYKLLESLLMSETIVLLLWSW